MDMSRVSNDLSYVERGERLCCADKVEYIMIDGWM